MLSKMYVEDCTKKMVGGIIEKDNISKIEMCDINDIFWPLEN